MIQFKDAYKIGHPFQYPKGLEYVLSNMTARKSRIPGIDHVVVFGVRRAMRELAGGWQEFFAAPGDAIVAEYKALVDEMLGGDIDVSHIKALHDLQYLPIVICALPEGTRCPIGVPFLTIENTHAGFGWVTNMIETQLSALLWKPITVATIAHRYRDVFEYYATLTMGEGVDRSFIEFQGHDFSMRGMSSLDDATMCGMAHLTAFRGTDTIPAILGAKEYYDATGFVGGSVPATEHSVACANGQDEQATLRRLLTEVYPSGVVSYVSDTWDFWGLVTTVLPSLRDVIMTRSGKLVIRPDSGDPVKILCGDPDAPEGTVERKGLVEVLWEIFGGTTTPAGYRLLDEHIGVIYGDSITLERQTDILQQLAWKGFASYNVVLGIGSFTYQYVTRDTFGMAIKSTWCQINGEGVDLYKAPKTDDGTKHSARGRLKVEWANDGAGGELVLKQGVSELESLGGELKEVFVNGVPMSFPTFQEIRTRARA